MATKIYWIYQSENSAKLGIMARPRGSDWLEEEIKMLKKNNTGLLVSLLKNDEIYELALGQEEELCTRYEIDFINFPIPDRDIPKATDQTDTLIKKLIDKIDIGISVVIHCRMGIGRSSIIAGSILLKKGLKTEHIFQHITKIRGLKVPDTDEQIAWLKSRE
jgi:protein-tyrosine phosphatase